MDEEHSSLSLANMFYEALDVVLDRHLEGLQRSNRGPVAKASIMAEYVANPPYGTRVSEKDILNALTMVAGLRIMLDFTEGDLLKKARKRGISFARIATALGLRSRQAAEQRCIKLQVGSSSGENAYLDKRRRDRLGSRVGQGYARTMWMLAGIEWPGGPGYESEQEQAVTGEPESGPEMLHPRHR
ncbi:hypothetical protein AB0K16_38585 [Nonomuraea jabiensis]|uniref:hypothetical protein n=1 Tax=Nonomuraea jabiensis TaxID=882448 RepID=UPI003412E49F